MWFPGSGQVQEADDKCTNSDQMLSSAVVATRDHFHGTVFRDTQDGCYVPKTLLHWPDFLNSGKVILKYSETDDLEMIRPEKTNCDVHTAQPLCPELLAVPSPNPIDPAAPASNQQEY